MKIYYTSKSVRKPALLSRGFKASMEGVEIRESLKKLKLICPTTEVGKMLNLDVLVLRKVGLLRAFLHQRCQKIELGIQDKKEKVHLK